MPSEIRISFIQNLLEGSPILPWSKSESNRALIINALSGGLIQIEGLSEAKDSKILQSLLESGNGILDAEDAGTAFRFLTSYLAISNKSVTLSGTERMKNRPIGILVDTLRRLGAQIEYLETDGFPPIRFNGFLPSNISDITIDATVSSQYISSLMMIAPLLANGLKINLIGDFVSSRPYIEMTWKMMEQAGIEVKFLAKSIYIPPQKYKSTQISIEADWSAAAYWFAVVAIVKNKAKLRFNNLSVNSLQGDSVICEIIRNWGVRVESVNNELQVFSEDIDNRWPSVFRYDFTNFPDLAQTILVICACTKTEAHFSGLRSLAVKETNRLKAMQLELRKVGVEVTIDENEGTWFLAGGQNLQFQNVEFETYDDHRMAMSLSIFSILGPIKIKNPDVVVKSYPNYWAQLREFGFAIESV